MFAQFRNASRFSIIKIGDNREFSELLGGEGVGGRHCCGGRKRRLAPGEHAERSQVGRQTRKHIFAGIVVVVLAGGALLTQTPVAAAEPSWTMPDLIGVDLQGAQDAIQSLTDGAVWLSTSTDATGQGRAQIMDRNWVVCSSTPAPGTSFTATTDIDFAVVRDTESCPS